MATSPPPSTPILSIPNSRKRPSISSVTSNPQNAKRRKPSNLRNSFAPDPNNGVSIAGTPRFSRSPSVDSSIAGTTITNGTAGGRRRRKGGDDSRSMTGTSVKGPAGAGSAVGTAGGANGEAGEDADDDDDDEGEGMEAVLEGGGLMDEAADKQEKEHMRILLEALTKDQTDRYDIYRRIKLKKEIVRKITNQTLSQSVPQPVIVTINGYTKVFIGELIDLALTVRDEWSAARTHLPNPTLPLPVLQTAYTKPSKHNPDAKPTSEDLQVAGLPPNAQVGKEGENGFWVKVDEGKGARERLRDSDKGPLTPDHLREALRRYKKDRSGGGAGFAGLSLEGVERTASRMGGRPLFR